MASGGSFWLGTLHSPISPIAATPRLYDLSRAAESAPNACWFRRRSLSRLLVTKLRPPVLPLQYDLIRDVTLHATAMTSGSLAYLKSHETGSVQIWDSDSHS